MDEPSPANTESVPLLISLLQMGAVFDIEVTKSHAICRLETHPDFELTTKLQLCHHFRIITWLSLTFKALVSQPIENLDPLILGQIPTRILHALIQVKHRIMSHRLTSTSSHRTPCNRRIFLPRLEGRAGRDVASSRHLLRG